ncbi:MAG: hypothetical protein EBX50_23395, partial [Chitinophagia bacterium]|nr:hypothetical protein [Chitinophagia bacterium]
YVPNRFNYQSVVRDTSGQLVVNQPVGIRISLQRGPQMTNLYTETHHLNTNSNGLLTTIIGSGQPTLGLIDTIDWSLGNVFVKTEIDPTGGINYSLLSTREMLSVPFALHARSADVPGPPGPQGPVGPRGIPGESGHGMSQIECCSPELYIGKYHQGGIIFCLDSTKQHGLVVHMEYIPTTSTSWSHTNCQVNGTSIICGSGQQNTLNIISQCADTMNYAIQCSNFVFDGYSDWYLPSLGELELINRNLKGIGKLADTFWGSYYYVASSSTFDTNNFWVYCYGSYPWQSPFERGIRILPKTAWAQILPIRSF